MGFQTNGHLLCNINAQWILEHISYVHRWHVRSRLKVMRVCHVTAASAPPSSSASTHWHWEWTLHLRVSFKHSSRLDPSFKPFPSIIHTHPVTGGGFVVLRESPLLSPRPQTRLTHALQIIGTERQFRGRARHGAEKPGQQRIDDTGKHDDQLITSLKLSHLSVSACACVRARGCCATVMLWCRTRSITNITCSDASWEE